MVSSLILATFATLTPVSMLCLLFLLSRRGGYALILAAIAGAGIEWFWTGRTIKKDAQRHTDASTVSGACSPTHPPMPWG